MVIVWHSVAKERLKDIFDYYLLVAGHKVAAKFIDKIQTSVERLVMMPLMASVELLLEGEPEMYRSLVIAERYKAIYYIDGEKIVVFDIWDCRQNPNSLRDRIVN